MKDYLFFTQDETRGIGFRRIDREDRDEIINILGYYYSDKNIELYLDGLIRLSKDFFMVIDLIREGQSEIVGCWFFTFYWINVAEIRVYFSPKFVKQGLLSLGLIEMDRFREDDRFREEVEKIGVESLLVQIPSHNSFMIKHLKKSDFIECGRVRNATGTGNNVEDIILLQKMFKNDDHRVMVLS